MSNQQSTIHTHTKGIHDMLAMFQLHMSHAQGRGRGSEWAGYEAGGGSPMRERSVLQSWVRLMEAGRVAEVWLAVGIIRGHLAGTGAAGGEQTHWSRQHTGIYGELRLAKSVSSFKISS